jgi:hypothetical protein
MSIKYYAHFLLSERTPRSMSEYRGVVELNRALPYDDLRDAASVLAKKLECNSKDIKVLGWSRLQ